VSQTPGKLERRARALLRAYPAEYRDGRAEEIIGTLLEAAPPGRSFPSVREAWSLVAGGRHARAARNRRPGVKANLRLALLLGISTYLGFVYCLMFATFIWQAPGGGASWLTNAEVAAGAATALAPWLGSRAATTALAVLAGTFYTYNAYRELSAAHGYATMAPHANVTITVNLLDWLVPLAALAALSGGPARLPRSWLWIPCAFPLALVAGRLLHRLLDLPRATLNPDSLVLGALVLLAVVVACWLATDPRPAFALCLAYLVYIDTATLPSFVYGDTYGVLIRSALISAVVLPVMIPATWLLLRRQKAPGSRPYPEP
jgi:hypothetical protein